MKRSFITAFCCSLLFSFIEDAKSYDPPLTIYPISIKFNYQSGYSNDALTIKKNNSTSIPVPEWNNFGFINEPMAYIKSQNNRKIQVSFYCNYSFEKTVSGFIYSPSQEPIGILGYQEILTFSGYISPYVTLTTQGTIPQSVGIRNFMWHWQLYVNGISTISYSTHTYYTLLGVPQSPMSVPWTEVLDHSCDWASGKTSESAAITEITKGAYNDFGNDHEYYGGGSHAYGTTFDLTDFLSDDWADCQDMSAVVQVFTRATGGTSTQVRRIWGQFSYQPILPIGKSQWVTGIWNFHQVGWKSNVWDACLKLKQSNPRIPVDENINGSYKNDLFEYGYWDLENPKSYATVY